MKNTSKFLSVLMMVVMVMSVFALSCAASDSPSGELGNNILWEFDSYTRTLTLSGKGDMPVDEEFLWRGYADEIETAVIGDGITSIAPETFYGANNLTNLTIGKDVVTIGDEAFAFCESLVSIILPDSVTTIGSEVFSGCYALETLTLGKSVTTIAEDAFLGFTPTSIVVDENNPNYMVDASGVLFNKDKTILVHYPAKSEAKSYVVPDGVTKILPGAFFGCVYLEEVTIPNSVAKLDMRAFSNNENFLRIIHSSSPVDMNEIISNPIVIAGAVAIVVLVVVVIIIKKKR